MIIFGTKTTNSRGETGMFNCPRCGRGKQFTHITVKKWFSLYFIPVIPMGDVGTYIQCQSCAGTFDEAMRSYDPEAEQAAFRANFERVVGQALAAMALADGPVAEAEVEVIANVLTRMFGTVHAAADVNAIIEDVRTRGLGLALILRTVSGRLNDRGKAMVIQALHTVSKADGLVTPAERALIDKAGVLLEMRRQEVEAIIGDGARQLPS